jgi:hypothetical protein
MAEPTRGALSASARRIWNSEAGSGDAVVDPGGIYPPADVLARSGISMTDIDD